MNEVYEISYHYQFTLPFILARALQGKLCTVNSQMASFCLIYLDFVHGGSECMQIVPGSAEERCPSGTKASPTFGFSKPRLSGVHDILIVITIVLAMSSSCAWTGPGGKGSSKAD
jgi:hypothetical protein